MRIRKAFLNTVTSLVYQVLLIISGLIVPRLVLQTYGSECNGVVSSVTQFLGIVSFLTAGLTGATRIELYKALAEKDNITISRIMNSTNKYMHKVAVVLAIYTAVLAVVYPVISNSSLSFQMIVSIILAIGVGKFFEYFLGIPYRILLQADQKNYIEYILSIVSCVMYTVVSIVMMNKGCSIISVKLASAMISLIIMLIICYYAKQCYDLKWNKKEKEYKLEQRKDAAIHSVANIIHQNSDLVILTFFVDVKLVSVYNVYYFVIGQIKKLLASFTDGLEAAFGNMWAKKEIEQLKRNFEIYEFLICILIIVVFSCVWTLIIPFITLYTENINDINYIRPTLAVLMTITEIIFCIRQPYVTLIQAAGKYKETKKVAIIEAGVNLCLSFILCYWIGIYGVIIGTLVANLIRTIYYMYYSYTNLLDRKIRCFNKRYFWLFVTFSIVLVVEIMMKKRMPILTWFDWIKMGVFFVILSSCITVVMAYIFERKMLMETLKIFRRI